MRRGALFVVLAAAAWGTNGTARELLADDAPPAAVGAMRLVVGGALLLVVFRPPLRGWPPGALAVAVGAIAAYQLLFFAGVDRAGVAVGTVVGIGTSPIAGGLLGRVLRHERLGPEWWVATALGLTGAGLLAGGGAPGPDVILGIVLACGAGAVYAVYVAASATLLDHHPPTDVAALVLGLAGICLVPVAIVRGASWALEPGGAALTAWLAVVTVLFAYPMLNRGLAVVGVGATATLTLTEPATAAVLGLAVLGEELDPVGWCGLALVAAGLAVEVAARQNR